MEALAHVNLPRLMEGVDDLATTYRAGQPFPHIVLDDVLHPEVFARAAAEFPGIRDEF
jgi:hypothetical protein